ncbi:MAG TPA: hypothetical protein PKI14_07060 [Fervidobacterium sp.]|jgi:hypothetical protein|nr:hypothetical protein [Fervidobacterium sp.]
MIRKTKKGYVVYSEDGKRLSKPYQIREQAIERLRQIEYFKHKKKKKGK